MREKYNLSFIFRDIDKKLRRIAINRRTAENLAKTHMGLEIFTRKYESGLKSIEKDRDKAYEFLHTLIDSIIVYSRPVVANDKVAGKKKAGVQQLIPNGLQIKLRLPQEFLNEKIIAGSFMGSGQNVHHRADGRN